MPSGNAALTITKLALAGAVLCLATGAAVGQTAQANLTPEQQQQLVDALRSRLLQSFSGMQRMEPAGPAANIANTSPVMSENALRAKLEALPPLPPGGARIERRRDGFVVNGQRYIDSEGAIISYGFDVLTGNVTYLAQIDNTNFVMKTTRVLTGVEPVTIATATKRAGTWLVQTVTGKRLNGTRIIPMATGVLVTRANVGFKYVAGVGTTSFAAPDAFDIAAFQNGDIAGTDYILLERRAQPPSNELASVIGSLQSIASTLGVARKDDYMLFNISTGKMIALNIPIEGKETNFYGGCVRKNLILSNCADVETYQSLFDQDGTPNLRHYFWRVRWFKTPSGPIMVGQDNGLSEIGITNLATGKRVVAFSRALGIAGFSADQAPDGGVVVIAQMGFSKEKIDDAAAFLASAHDAKPPTTEVSQSRNVDVNADAMTKY